jgi:hypothetical protein
MCSWGWDDDPAKKLHVIGPENLQKALETAQTHRQAQADICKAKLDAAQQAEQRVLELQRNSTPLPTVNTAKKVLQEARRSYLEAESQHQDFIQQEGELEVALSLLADSTRRKAHRAIGNDIASVLAQCKVYKADLDDVKQESRDEYDAAAGLPLDGGTGGIATLDDITDVIPDAEERQQMWLDRTLPNVKRILNDDNEVIDTDSAPSAPLQIAADMTHVAPPSAHVDATEQQAARQLAALMD